MIVFRDRKGRTWARRIDVDAAVRMRDLADVDVMALGVDDEAANRFAGDSSAVSAQIVDALFAIFLPDVDRTPKTFGKSLRGAVAPHELRQLLFAGVDAFFKLPGPKPEPTEDDDVRVTADELWRHLYRMAGRACVAPGPYTFGELVVMADGRRKLEWEQTACLRADLLNSAFGSKGGNHPADLDPSGGLKEAGAAKKQQVEITADDIGLLARMFVR